MKVMTRQSIPLRPLPSQPQRSGFFKVCKFSSFSHFQVRSLLAAHTHREMVKDSQVSDCKLIFAKAIGQLGAKHSTGPQNLRYLGADLKFAATVATGGRVKFLSAV